MIYTRNLSNVLAEFKKNILLEFGMIDLEFLHYFLGKQLFNMKINFFALRKIY